MKINIYFKQFHLLVLLGMAILGCTTPNTSKSVVMPIKQVTATQDNQEKVNVVEPKLIKLSSSASNSEQVFVDKTSGLMWQDYEHIKRKILGWEESINYCKNLDYRGFSDWYLPSLNTLADLRKNKKQLSSYEFGYYWSSTLYNPENEGIWGKIDHYVSNKIEKYSGKKFSKQAYIVSFHYDESPIAQYIDPGNNVEPGYEAYVRCVRKIQKNDKQSEDLKTMYQHKLEELMKQEYSITSKIEPYKEFIGKFRMQSPQRFEKLQTEAIEKSLEFYLGKPFVAPVNSQKLVFTFTNKYNVRIDSQKSVTDRDAERYGIPYHIFQKELYQSKYVFAYFIIEDEVLYLEHFVIPIDENKKYRVDLPKKVFVFNLN